MGCWGGTVSARKGPAGLTRPLPPTRMLGLPGKCPSLRAPPPPRRRDRPTDAEKKREMDRQKKKKSLNNQKRGTRLCGEGWKAQTAAPLCALGPAVSQQVCGQVHTQGEKRAGARRRGALGTHLAGHSGLLGRLGALAAVSSLHWPCPKTARGFLAWVIPHPLEVLVISTSSWEPTWLGHTCPCLQGSWAIGLLLVALGKVIQVAHVTRFHAHEARKALHVIIPANRRPGMRAGVRGCGLGPRRAGRHSRGTALPQQHPGQSEA